MKKTIAVKVALKITEKEIEQYLTVNKEFSKLKKVRDALTEKLKATGQKNRTVKIGKYSIRKNITMQMRVSKALLESKYPDIYDEVVVESPTTRMEVTESVK